MYVATYDAVSRILSAAFGKGSGRDPWYLRPEGTLVGMTPELAEAAFDRLAARFPNRVGRVN